MMDGYLPHRARRAAREFYQEVYGSSRAFTVTSNAFSVTIRARKDAGP